MAGPSGRSSRSSAGIVQVDNSTPEATRRSTIRGSAGFTTAMCQAGHRKTYEPGLSSMHPLTRTSAVVSSTSPHWPQVARMVGTNGSIGLDPWDVERFPLVASVNEPRDLEDLTLSERT